MQQSLGCCHALSRHLHLIDPTYPRGARCQPTALIAGAGTGSAALFYLGLVIRIPSQAATHTSVAWTTHPRIFENAALWKSYIRFNFN
jgi:hypothetical protein